MDKQRFNACYLSTMVGGTVCWHSTLQFTIALSTIEAEYTTVIEAFKEAVMTLNLYLPRVAIVIIM